MEQSKDTELKKNLKTRARQQQSTAIYHINITHNNFKHPYRLKIRKPKPKTRKWRQMKEGVEVKGKALNGSPVILRNEYKLPALSFFPIKNSYFPPQNVFKGHSLFLYLGHCSLSSTEILSILGQPGAIFPLLQKHPYPQPTGS